jgi:hypothetical protein
MPEKVFFFQTIFTYPDQTKHHLEVYLKTSEEMGDCYYCIIDKELKMNLIIDKSGRWSDIDSGTTQLSITVGDIIDQYSLNNPHN